MLDALKQRIERCREQLGKALDGLGQVNDLWQPEAEKALDRVKEARHDFKAIDDFREKFQEARRLGQCLKSFPGKTNPTGKIPGTSEPLL